MDKPTPQPRLEFSYYDGLNVQKQQLREWELRIKLRPASMENLIKFLGESLESANFDGITKTAEQELISEIEKLIAGITKTLRMNIYTNTSGKYIQYPLRLSETFKWAPGERVTIRCASDGNGKPGYILNNLDYSGPYEAYLTGWIDKETFHNNFTIKHQ